MLFDYDKVDGFDDEPRDLLLEVEGDPVNVDDELFEDEDFLKAEPDRVDRKDGDGDDNDESTSDDRIVQMWGGDKLKEVVSSSVAIAVQRNALFQSYERNNHAYANAVIAYYEEKNYQRAIEKFDEAIKDAFERTVHDLTEEQADEIIAKSMYWQAEAYIKTQDVPKALEIFRSLVQDCQGHYLALAAQRRVDELSAKDS